MTVHGKTALAMCVVFLTSLPACSHSVPVEGFQTPEIVVPMPPVVLQVENHNWADVVLYVVHDGVETRFAQVAAAHNLSVEIPGSLQGQMGVIQIAARRIGGTDSYLSQSISLRGNSAVRFTIESTLNHSSVGVW
jgi:hypothetical protein